MQPVADETLLRKEWFMDSQLIYFVLVVFVSFFVYSLVGFGAGLVGVPLLLLFMDAKQVIPAFIAIIFINGLSLVREGRNHVQWKHVRRLWAGALFGVPIGVMCLKYLPSRAIAVGVNLLVCAFACFYLSGIKFRIKKDRPAVEAVIGLIGGILSGGTGAGGPPVVMYGILRDWRKDVFHSTMLVYFVGLGVWTNTSHLLMRMHSMETVRMILIGLIPAFSASWIGTKAKRKVDENLFRRIVLVVVIISSLLGIGRYLLGYGFASRGTQRSDDVKLAVSGIFVSVPPSPQEKLLSQSAGAAIKNVVGVVSMKEGRCGMGKMGRTNDEKALAE